MEEDRLIELMLGCFEQQLSSAESEELRALVSSSQDHRKYFTLPRSTTRTRPTGVSARKPAVLGAAIAPRSAMPGRGSWPARWP